MKLLPGQYGFDDVKPGDQIETPAETITAEMVDAFAAVTGDRFEIHMDDDAARRHGFSSRVAHGLLVLSLTDGLKNRSSAQFKARASLDWTWTFSKPVLVGDRIRAVITIKDKTPTRKPDQGVLHLQFDTINQRDETVQRGNNHLLVYR